MMKIKTGLGDRLDKAISRLDSFCAAGTLKWLLGLYDGERGGFYYSDSAKRYEGFLPDAESTTQVISLLYGGAVKGAKGRLGELMPPDMRERLEGFILSLEDDDGYFYHPQWGKKISDTRRSCDLACCKSLIERLGLKSKSVGAAEGTQANSGGAKEKKTGEHLASREALTVYLDGLLAESDINSVATRLKNEYKEIKDASLSSALFDHLDAVQDKYGTGYWQSGADSSAAVGVYRIGSLYNEDGRRIPRAEQLIESCVGLILSNTVPECITEIHGMWAALATVMKNVQLTAEGDDGTRRVALIYSLVRAKAPEMIDKTLKWLRLFKKLSGGYSYYRGYSPAYTHGVHVSLGINEGDVNATVIALHGVRANIFSSLGLSVPPIWQESELMRLMSKPHRSIRKLPIPRGFENDAPVKI